MKRLLIVDDNEDICDALAMNLEHTYEIRIAHDGREALRLIDAGGIDAVVLDLMMPILDGAQVMRALNAREHAPPVVLASAARDLEEQARVLRSADWISKPFDIASLEAKLVRVLGGEGPGGSGPPPGTGGEPGGTTGS